MHLHGDFGQADFCRHLLIHQARHNKCHYLSFAVGEHGEPSRQFRLPLVGLSSRTIAIKCHANGVQKILFSNRFCKEFDCAGLHRLYGHGNIAVPRDENDRHGDVCVIQFALEIEAAQSGQTHIQYEAAYLIRFLAL